MFAEFVGFAGFNEWGFQGGNTGSNPVGDAKLIFPEMKEATPHGILRLNEKGDESTS